MKEKIEPDDFNKGLELGVWDEDFGYYRTAGEIAMKNIIELEPEVTNQEDMKNGDW